MDKKKPTIIIIEDNKGWLAKLSEIVLRFFDVTVELESDFFEAEKRLFDNPNKFDLLITDIYPDDKSRETTGLNFIDFVNIFKNKPVIVVTAETRLVGTILKDYRVIAAFEKSNFEKMEFIKAISKIIKPRNDNNEDISDNVHPKPLNPNNFNLG